MIDLILLMVSLCTVTFFMCCCEPFTCLIDEPVGADNTDINVDSFPVPPNLEGTNYGWDEVSGDFVRTGFRWFTNDTNAVAVVTNFSPATPSAEQQVFMRISGLAFGDKVHIITGYTGPNDYYAFEYENEVNFPVFRIIQFVGGVPTILKESPQIPAGGTPGFLWIGLRYFSSLNWLVVGQVSQTGFNLFNWIVAVGVTLSADYTIGMGTGDVWSGSGDITFFRSSDGNATILGCDVFAVPLVCGKIPNEIANVTIPVMGEFCTECDQLDGNYVLDLQGHIGFRDYFYHIAIDPEICDFANLWAGGGSLSFWNDVFDITDPGAQQRWFRDFGCVVGPYRNATANFEGPCFSEDTEAFSDIGP